MPDSSSKSGSPRQPSSRPPFRRDWPGIRFSSWNAGFQLEKRIPKTTLITVSFQEGLAGDPELECRIPARKAGQPSSRPPVRRDWPGIELGMPDSSSKSGSPRQPSSRPPFRRDWPGIRFSSWNAGSKSGSPRQPSSRPPFRRDWPGIRFSSWNAGFQLEKRIPKTTFITAPFQEGSAFSAETVLFFPHIWLFFSALRGSHVFRAQRRASRRPGKRVRQNCKA